MTKRMKKQMASYGLWAIATSIICILALGLLAGCTKSQPPDPALVKIGKTAFMPCSSRSYFLDCDGAFLRSRSDPVHVYWLQGYENNIPYLNYRISRKTLWMSVLSGDGVYVDVEELVLPTDKKRWNKLAAQYMRQQLH